MAVRLREIDVRDPDVRELQSNVSDAVEELSNQLPPAGLGVLAVSANTKLVGNEDVVLVDAGAAAAAITLVLPSPKIMQRLLTVKVTRQGSQNVVVKAVDIAGTSSPQIDSGASVTVPAGGSLRIISDGRNFWTV